MQIQENVIILKESENFDIKAILECGQIFRFGKTPEGDWFVLSKNHKCVIKQNGGHIYLVSDNPQYFRCFFDLDTDYAAIQSEIAHLPLMQEAFTKTRGLRILKQDKFETIIGFILSANNHLKRIRSLMERIADTLGDPCADYRAFPSPEVMAAKDADFYRDLGAGYRAPYLTKTAQMIAEGFEPEALSKLPSTEIVKNLCRLPGVGPKVADCILLFAYGRTDSFPVDTWVKKIYRELFDKENTLSQMRSELLQTYGQYAGIAQQYLFYYKRESKNQF